MAGAVNATVVDENMTGDHYSWQDVYSSYGCSMEIDAADDGG